MAMSVQQREAFLAEPWVGVVAVTDDAGRGPLLVPVWYHYRPGGEVSVLTGRHSRKAALIRRAGVVAATTPSETEPGRVALTR